MIKIFTDGGVIKRNPSPIGGTWAFHAVMPSWDNYRNEDSGIIPGTQDNPVTNNQTELFAIIQALKWIPTKSLVTYCICSDSQISLGRVFFGWAMSNISIDMQTELENELYRLSDVKIKQELYAGHPTKKQLERGWNDKKNLPVSKWNVHCDEMCRQEAEKYLAFLEKA